MTGRSKATDSQPHYHRVKDSSFSTPPKKPGLKKLHAEGRVGIFVDLPIDLINSIDSTRGKKRRGLEVERRLREVAMSNT